MISKKFQAKCRIILIETLFIGFLAILFLNIAAYLFSIAANLPQNNFGLLGRWMDMICHGQFTSPSISNEPAVSHELALGLLGHLFTSFIFTLTYLLFCTIPFFRKISPLISGLLFGLILMVFPLFIEYPAMGIHVFAVQWPYLTFGILRIITCHAFFGIGLGLGRLLLEYIRNARVSTSVV